MNYSGQNNQPAQPDNNNDASPPAGRQQTAYITITPAARNPRVTQVLLGVTIFIFLLQFASQSLLQGIDLPGMFGMKINELIIEGEVWRLITPAFLHGSFFHLAFNMYALHIFGSGLERHYGHARFLALYFLSAYAGNVASFLLSPNPSLGASTSIFGLVAAEGVFIYRNRFLFGKNARSMLLNIVTIVAINLFLGLSPGIDNWGHLGGLIGGFLFAWYAGPSLKVEGEYPMLTVKEQVQKQTILHGAAIIFLLITLMALTYRFFQ